ncbi:MAG: MBL fold metallo-hydrolase [Candidatus Aenigmarchaeota archaeon ex4484_224]|nr:MAG: MBL fold metallo-hydrolase [Candidatus Aenigmarchaeota archaeon ex4484_224]
MKIFPLAFDSFGVRSQSTFVKVGNLGIHLDPGVALGPTRYGLPPTQEEYLALELSRKKIMQVSKKAKISIVTHYHYDHHPHPDDDEMYKACFSNKIVFAKDISKNINFSGKKRGKYFEEKVKPIAKSLEYVDGKSFDFGNVHIEFSPAVWHGEVKSQVGTVIMVYIEKGKDSFLFGSDAQNLADPQALKWVLEKNPKFMILDGYPTIFIGWKKSKKSFEKSKENLRKAILETQAKTIILDHHILRDIHYKEKMKDIFEDAENVGKKILTAAEYYGLENFFLEAWRKEIHEGKMKVDVKGYYKKLFSKIKI